MEEFEFSFKGTGSPDRIQIFLQKKMEISKSLGTSTGWFLDF
jgi:hypothetical protein